MIIRDPVHKDIFLDDIERKIMDTKEMQRLRYIKQLGTAHYVYPGAVHTRFSHSLGTFHLTKSIINILKIKGFSLLDDEFSKIKIAALIHDVGHICYGHTLEDENPIFNRHDGIDRFRMLINENTELGFQLEKLGIEDDILSILTDEPANNPIYKTIYKNIISNTICADFLDYIKRDGYYTGLYLDYDPRVLQYFEIFDENLCLSFNDNKGMFRWDKISDILNLLRLRLFESERVIYHHTKMITGAMIAKAVNLEVHNNNIDERKLLYLKDEELFNLLKSSKTAGVKWLIESLSNRKLLKRAYLIHFIERIPHSNKLLFEKYQDPEECAKVEKEIADKLKLEPYKVILTCPKIILKEAEVLIKFDNELSTLKEMSEQGKIGSEVNEIVKHYKEISRLFVFVPKECQNKGSKICEDIIGEPNKFPKI